MPRRNHPIARAGLSLLELLLAVTMISILIVGAFLSYQDYVDDARKVSTRNRMDALRKALEAWNADHKRPYGRWDPDNVLRQYSLDPLLGRYIPSKEEDGWGADFIVDPYFMRIVSRGSNGLLETSIPGHPESPVGGDGGDDLVVEARENGRLVVLGASPGLHVIRPDGGRQNQIDNADAVGGDVAPGGGIFAWTDGTDIWRQWLSDNDSVGDFDLTSDSIKPAVDATWISTRCGSSWGSLAIAPDGVNVVALCDEGSDVSLWGGELAAPWEGQRSPTRLIYTFPNGVLVDGHLTGLSWDRSGARVWTEGVNGPTTYLLKVTSAPGAIPTTPTWGNRTGQVTRSPSFAASTARVSVVLDDKTQLLSSTGSLITSHDVTGSGDIYACLNRHGDAIVVGGGDESLWIWWPDRALSPANPFRVMEGPDVLARTGGIAHLAWR